MIITRDKAKKWLDVQIRALKNKTLFDEEGTEIAQNLMFSREKELQICGIENLANVLGVEIQCINRECPSYNFKYEWYFYYKDYRVFCLQMKEYVK